MFAYTSQSTSKSTSSLNILNEIYFSASIGDKENLQTLIEKKKLSSSELGEAAAYAAMQNQVECLKYLYSKGANLFQQDELGYTCLHVACENGYSSIVQAILDTHPNDELLDITTYSTPTQRACTAYHLATLRNHLDCIELLKNTRQACWHNLGIAFTSRDKTEFRRLLETTYPYDNIFAEPGQNRHWSLLAWIAEYSQTDSAIHPFYQACLDYINKINPEKQIIILTHALTHLYVINNGDVKKRNYVTLCERLMQQDEAYFANVVKLSFNGMSLCENTWGVVKKILMQNRIQIIDLVGSSPSVEEIPFCLVNFSQRYLMEFISLLLKNCELKKCDLLPITKSKPALTIINLILERNRLMRESPYEITQDHTYNKFIIKINEQILLLKSNYPNDAELLQELTPIRRVYSLLQACAFFAAKMNDEEMRKISLPNEANDFIADVKKYL